MHTAQVSALLLRLPPPSTSFMVREQIHFWFSPQNLARDRFLQAQMAKSKERCACIVVTTFLLLTYLLTSERYMKRV